MKIVSIFAENLFSVHFKNEEYNEFDKIFDQWGNVEYIREFIKKNINDFNNQKTTIDEMVEKILEDSEYLEDLLNRLCLAENIEKLDYFFKPLDKTKKTYLPRKKGRIDYLRIYAIKIDSNMYIITGGAIKFHQEMSKREHTQKELSKLDRCLDYFKENFIEDGYTFSEFLDETT